MVTTSRTIHELTAADLMSRDVVTIHPGMALRAAAHLLRHADISGVPVVDDQGRCVGMLSAVDFLRWTEEKPHAERQPIHTCPYQTEGRLLGGQETVVCTLGPGRCLLQVMQPTEAGPHTPVCLMPHDVLCDSQQVPEEARCDEVARYMTKDVVSARPDTPLPELARMMIDAHIHRVLVTDEHERPVGIVSATDVLAALAREACAAVGPPPWKRNEKEKP
jgi:CBS domain-containing protein